MKRMNPIDRLIFWLLLHLISRRMHQRFPHWVKALINRWMKHRGDPGDSTEPA